MSSADAFLQRATAYLEDGRDTSQDPTARFEALDASRAALLDARRAQAPPLSLLPIFTGIISSAGRDSSPIVRIVVPHVIEEFCFRDPKSFVPPATPFLLRALHDEHVLVAKRAVRALTTLFRRLVGFAVSVGVGDAFPEARFSAWMQMKDTAVAHMQSSDEGLRKAATKFAETVVLAFSYSGSSGSSSDHFTLEYALKRRPDSPLLDCAKLEQQGVHCVRAVAQLVHEGLAGNLLIEKPDGSFPIRGTIPPASFMTAITVLSNLVRRRPKLIDISLPPLLSVVAAITANSYPPSRAFLALTPSQQLSLITVLRISLSALRGFAHTRAERHNNDISAAMADLAAYERDQENRKKERASAVAKQFQAQDHRQHQVQRRMQEQQPQQVQPQQNRQPHMQPFPPLQPLLQSQPPPHRPLEPSSLLNPSKAEAVSGPSGPSVPGPGPPPIPLQSGMHALPTGRPIESALDLRAHIPPHLLKRPRGPGLAMQMGPRLPNTEAFALSQSLLRMMPPQEVVNFIMTRLLLNIPPVETVPGASETVPRPPKRSASTSEESSAKRLKRTRFGAKGDTDRGPGTSQPVKKVAVRKVAPPVVPVIMKPDVSEQLAILCCRRVLMRAAQAEVSGAAPLRLQLLGRLLTSLTQTGGVYKTFCNEVCEFIVKNLDKELPLARTWLHCLAVSDGLSQFAQNEVADLKPTHLYRVGPKLSELPSDSDDIFMEPTKVAPKGKEQLFEGMSDVDGTNFDKESLTKPSSECELQVEKSGENESENKACENKCNAIEDSKSTTELQDVKGSGNSESPNADPVQSFTIASKNNMAISAIHNDLGTTNVNGDVELHVDKAGGANTPGVVDKVSENRAGDENSKENGEQKGAQGETGGFNEMDIHGGGPMEEVEDTDDDLQVGSGYVEIFMKLIYLMRDKHDIDPKQFEKMISEAPVIPDDFMKVIIEMAKEAASTRLSLLVLATMAMDRPGKDRDKSLRMLLNLACDNDDAVRGQTIRLISNKLFVDSDGELQEEIEKIVVDAFSSIVEDICKDPHPESKLRLERLERVSSLMTSLCGQKHELIRHIAEAFIKVPTVGKELLISKARDIAVHVGVKSEPLLTFVRGDLLPLKPLQSSTDWQTDGADNLAAQILHALVHKFGTSDDGVVKAGMRRFELCGNVELLICVLAGVDREYAVKHLGTVVEYIEQAPEDDSQGKSKKKSADALKFSPSSYSSQDVISKLCFGKNASLSPADLLIELHKIKATAATSKFILSCFEYKTIFKQEVIAQAVQHLIEFTDIPDLFLRTVMLARVWHPELEGYLTETVMKRLIEKRVWMKPLVWDGFLRYCLEIKEKSAVKLLLSLPSSQLEDALLQKDGLRSIFRELAKSKNASKLGAKHRKAILAALKKGSAKQK